MRRTWRLATALLLAAAGTAAFTAGQAVAGTTAHHVRALLVCNGSTKPCPAVPHYRTVQAAVDAARPGDWVLIWPGVYHENNSYWHAGVWVGTRGIHIRGLNRNTVIIDGSKGSAKHPCPSSPALQNYAARDGIDIVASAVTVENLTVCNYLSGSKGGGNEIWWNGGDGSGKIGLHLFYGSYLTATSEYRPKSFKNVPNYAQYGIFVSNSDGGAIVHSYASNMADAAYYVGACQRVCNTLLRFDRGTNSALGYSGTNSGGYFIITRSEFDHNRTGLAPNSLNNSDAPPPQDGRCPKSATTQCMVILDNLIAHNNNPNVPISGLKPAIGTGVEISGGSYDAVIGNRIIDNGAWGVITHDYPDPETPPPGSNCQGGIPNQPLTGWCLFLAQGNRVAGNTFIGNGFFGNTGNGDLATETLLSATPVRNCFYGNAAFNRSGHSVPLTSMPADIQSASVDGPPCTGPGTGNIVDLYNQLVCATGFTTCPVSGANYPAQTKLVLVPLPRLKSMPNPCSGVPRNGFCRR